MGTLAIDPGVHNLAVAVVGDDGAIRDWRTVDLVRAKKPPIARIVAAAVDFGAGQRAPRGVGRFWLSVPSWPALAPLPCTV